MKIHHLSAEEALHSLHTSAQGLTRREAERRLREFGPNRVEKLAGEPLLLRFLKEFTHFFALILWLAAGMAFSAEHFGPGQGMAMLGWAILGVILINGLFSFWQEYRAGRAIAALEKLLPSQVTVMREGEVERLAAEQLLPGDIWLLQEGDKVPADCRLIEAYGVRVNNATVTGESLPKARHAQPCTEEEALQARNILLAGTSVVSGEGRAVVFATGKNTEFGRIAHLTQSAVSVVSPLQQEIARLSRLVAALATGLGLAFFLIGQLIGLSFWQNLLFAIGIIVANVPEGLLPTVTLSLAMATQRMARRNALIRHLPAVETLGSATVICTDKTGTLTCNRMAAKQVFLGTALQYAGAIDRDSPDSREFLAVARHCHNLKNGGNGLWLGDPMETALLEWAQPGASYPRLDEIPFDTDRKRMSTLHSAPGGPVLYTKGAPETVLPLCASVLIGGQRLALNDALRQRFLDAHRQMAEQGLRVLAFAYRTVAKDLRKNEWEQEMVLLGLAGLEDPPRPDVAEAVSRCREAGIRVIMITGDHPRTAAAIAREIGLVQGEAPSIVNGEQLRRLSNIQLQIALDAPEILFARITADQKLRIVAALQRKGEVVAVTGDGVNDAPALKQADIGIAMGLSGTDVARESADMILLDDHFASIVAAVEEGRAVFDNLRKFFTYILTHNIAELVPYLAFALFRIPLPLTVMQILAVDLGTDTVPALGLGAERPDPGIMRRPPRPRSERLLSWGLLVRAYLFLGAIEAAAAMAAFFFVLHRGGWRYGDILPVGHPLYLQATAATLSAIIAMQVVNVYLCRSPRGSVFSRPLFGNRLILIGIAVEVLMILAIDYTPLGNRLFGTAPLQAEFWLFLLPFAAAMLLLEEGRKWIARRSGARMLEFKDH
ncbi:MAG: cation-transporting P-type ATPase [Sulfuricellaceae bacterium]|nr:cation-transporting P-type ATPase [Sulfuricellaceae bacterium]